MTHVARRRHNIISRYQHRAKKLGYILEEAGFDPSVSIRERTKPRNLTHTGTIIHMDEVVGVLAELRRMRDEV